MFKFIKKLYEGIEYNAEYDTWFNKGGNKMEKISSGTCVKCNTSNDEMFKHKDVILCFKCAWLFSNEDKKAIKINNLKGSFKEMLSLTIFETIVNSQPNWCEDVSREMANRATNLFLKRLVE